MTEAVHNVVESLQPLLMPLADLNPDPENARTHDARNVQAIMDSLQRFGQDQPLVVQRDGMIVRKGNGRAEAMRRLGWTHAAAVIVDDVTEEAIARALSDNRSAELAGWDKGVLGAHLVRIGEEQAKSLGWNRTEFERYADRLRPVTEDDGGGKAPAEPITKPGDLWILGEHRLLCGDSTRPECVEFVMNGERAQLFSTDPPYAVKYKGDRPVGGKDWTATYNEIADQDAAKFFDDVFRCGLAVCDPDAALYVWHSPSKQKLIADAWEANGILFHQQIVWVKPAAIIGRMYWLARHECCAMGWRRGHKPRHDGANEYPSTWFLDPPHEPLAVLDISDVWELDWDELSRTEEHPTPKPLEIFARPMRKHTESGALCFEPFSGSGAQIIAAEQMRRRCYAIELTPTFCDVAVRRWERLTGRRAERKEAACVIETVPLAD